MPYSGRSVQWPHCDGRGDLVYVLGFRLSNDRGFLMMTVLGTVKSRKNVRGSIERSIVGLFCLFLGLRF